MKTSNITFLNHQITAPKDAQVYRCYELCLILLDSVFRQKKKPKIFNHKMMTWCCILFCRRGFRCKEHQQPRRTCWQVDMCTRWQHGDKDMDVRVSRSNWVTAIEQGVFSISTIPSHPIMTSLVPTSSRARVRNLWATDWYPMRSAAALD